MPGDAERALRDAVVATALAMNARGINRGKSGNVSARCAQRGLRRLPRDADRACRTTEIGPDDIVAMHARRRGPRARGCRRPNGASIATSIARGRTSNADRAHARAVRHHARLPFARHSRVPLHGRGRRRPRHPLRAVRDVRHAGAVRSRGRRARRAQARACSRTTE